MAERHNSGVNIKRIEKLSIVSLKVSSKLLDDASDRLQLASPQSAIGGDPRSLWIGPDRWLIVSSSMSAESLLKKCEEALGDVLHNVVDNSAGLAVFRLTGSGVRDLLAAGCGIDFRDEKFPVGYCCRTRLAQIAVVIVAEGPEQFDIYVDRSYEKYLSDWLRDSLSISARAGEVPYEPEAEV